MAWGKASPQAIGAPYCAFSAAIGKWVVAIAIAMLTFFAISQSPS